jgi:hypothetical protein
VSWEAFHQAPKNRKGSSQEQQFFNQERKINSNRRENLREPHEGGKNIQGRPWVVLLFYFVGNWTNRRISSIIPLSLSLYFFLVSFSHFLPSPRIHPFASTHSAGKSCREPKKKKQEISSLASLFISFSLVHRLSIV